MEALSFLTLTLLLQNQNDRKECKTFSNTEILKHNDNRINVYIKMFAVVIRLRVEVCYVNLFLKGVNGFHVQL